MPLDPAFLFLSVMVGEEVILPATTFEADERCPVVRELTLSDQRAFGAWV